MLPPPSSTAMTTTSAPAPTASHALRPPMLAASFLLPRRQTDAAASANAGGPISSRPSSLRLDAAGRRISSHYHPHEWSHTLHALQLTQPLLLPPPPPPVPAHLRGSSLPPPPGSASASALQTAGSSSASDPRDVQLEVGCSMELLRALCIVSGSWVEVESANAGAGTGASSAPPRALARLRLVRLDDQLFEGKRRAMAAMGAPTPADPTATALQPLPSGALGAVAAATAAAAVGVSAASVLLLPPSLHFHLFASASPLPSAAMPDDAGAPLLAPLMVRIRKFLPPVPTAHPQLQNMVHTLRNGQ